MTRNTIAITERVGADAGRELADRIRDQLGEAPDAVIVFASPDQDHGAMLRALTDGCAPRELVGCSSAGEFTSDAAGVGMTCAVALHAPEMSFASAMGRGLRADRATVAEELVAVEDQGIGIAPEEMERIFEPFVREEGGHTRSHGGSGLGLSISRRLARLMGGEVTVRSRKGMGSRFSVRLPAATPAD